MHQVTIITFLPMMVNDPEGWANVCMKLMIMMVGKIIDSLVDNKGTGQQRLE